MYSLTKFLLICFFLVGTEIIRAQTISLNESKKKLEFDGSEKSNNQNPKVISVNSTNYSSPEIGDVFTYNFHNITDIKTGYDHQSNGSTQEVWYDLNNDLLHSIFTNSQASFPPREFSFKKRFLRCPRLSNTPFLCNIIAMVFSSFKRFRLIIIG